MTQRLLRLFAAASFIIVPVSAHPAENACEQFKTFAHGRRGQPDGFNTEALVVLKDAKTVYEWYEPSTKPGTPHVMWSISKMITATITGAAAEKGLLSLEDPLAKYVPFPAGRSQADFEHYGKIKIHHLMAFTPGIKWQESGSEDVRTTSIGHMLYSTGYRDVVKYYLSQPMWPYDPGDTFTYSSGNPILQMAALRKILGKNYASAPWDLLFTPLKIESAHWEQDAAGNFIAGAYAYVSARDLAKIGQLYLDDGVADGKRILPADYSKRAQTLIRPIREVLKTQQDVVNLGLWSELGFWLNQSVNGLKPPFPSSPEDMYLSAGMDGQLLFVLPTQKLVIARTGFDKGYWKQVDQFVSLAVQCFGGNSK